MVIPKAIKDGRIVVDGVAMLSPDIAELLPNYRLRVGDIVGVRTGSLGRHALVRAEQSDWLFGTGCFRLRPSEAVTSEYLVQYMNSALVRDLIERNAHQGTIPSLNVKTINSLPVLVPPIEVQLEISDVLGALDEKIAVHSEICRSVTELRDLLSPLLLTGAIPPSKNDDQI